MIALRVALLVSLLAVGGVAHFFFSSRRRHTRWTGDWSSDVCSSDLGGEKEPRALPGHVQVDVAERVLADRSQAPDRALQGGADALLASRRTVGLTQRGEQRIEVRGARAHGHSFRRVSSVCQINVTARCGSRMSRNAAGAWM